MQDNNVYPGAWDLSQGDEAANLFKRSNLTGQQLIFWVGQKLQPNFSIYNMAMTFTIPSAIDSDLFRKAFQILVNSSDALRTVIEEIEGVPQQRALVKFPYMMDCLDLSHTSDPDAELRRAPA